MHSGAFSFPRDVRLLSKQAFQSVFDGPDRRFRLQGLLLLCRNNGLSHSRLGMVVAKKHIKRANKRNQVKRWIREKFRLILCHSTHIDVVAIVNRPISLSEWQGFHDQLEQGFYRLKKLCQD